MLLILLGVFLVSCYIFTIPLAPFRFDSLVTIFIFLMVARIISTYLSSFAFFFAVVTSLIFSTFLSPYTLIIYLGLYLIILKLAHRA